MAQYTYPSSMELKQIEQVLLPQLTQDDPIFDLFPITEAASFRVRWEQLDNYYGLQAVRGLNGAPAQVNRIGAKSYDYAPGVYGEFTVLDEKEITERRQLGTFGDPISLNDLVALSQQHLLQRRIDRIRFILWTLLTTGTFSIAKPNGEIAHTDAFPLQTYTAGTPWSTVATSTPFSDIRALSLLYRGQSVEFGGNAKLFMNRTKLNQVLTNQNTVDVFGRRSDYGATFNSLDDVNKFLYANDLPSIVPYDRGYYDDNGTFQLFIPNNRAVLVGARTNKAALGEYRMVRNANNPNVEPGPYTQVIDRGTIQLPRQIQVHDGHNGGPVIYFPGAVVVVTC